MSAGSNVKSLSVARTGSRAPTVPADDRFRKMEAFPVEPSIVTVVEKSHGNSKVKVFRQIE